MAARRPAIILRWEMTDGWASPRVWLDDYEVCGLLDVQVSHMAKELPRVTLVLVPKTLTSDLATPTEESP